MIYIGIDPGKSGAMAVLFNSDSSSPEIHTFSHEAYRDAMERFEGNLAKCCLERVGAMPKQGVSSTFSFGENYGFIQGLLTAFEIPYQLIPPRTWKAEFGLNSDKEKSVSVCKRLFPNVSLRRTERCRKDDDGMAEALLMAEYARRRL